MENKELNELLAENPWEEENKVKCPNCGEWVYPEDCEEVNGELICNDCLEAEFFHCDNCGDWVHENNCFVYDGDVYCYDCVDRCFVRCYYCDELIPRNYDYYVTADGDVICEDCRDNYTYCSRCGELYHNDYITWDDDTDEPYCDGCWDYRIRRGTIKQYHYKPIPRFYGEAPFYMGVELEIDKGGENHEKAEKILNAVNEYKEHAYAKHDGSIHNGFEIVSHPATLEYHRYDIDWEELMRRALELGYRSHDTDTCGLHVHVSRNALGNTYDEQDETISKILYFVESNWNYILKFTRRTENNLSHWASRYGLEPTVSDTYKKAKGDYNRYRCINLQNDHTIEFRVFRGTLKYTTFLATLQFVHAVCNICMNATTDNICDLGWYEFTSQLDSDRYVELINYLTEKNLY